MTVRTALMMETRTCPRLSIKVSHPRPPADILSIPPVSLKVDPFALDVAAKLDPSLGIDLAALKTDAVVNNAVAVVERQEEGKLFVYSIFLSHAF
jgi:hypothetical protein